MFDWLIKSLGGYTADEYNELFYTKQAIDKKLKRAEKNDCRDEKRRFKSCK